MSDIFQIAGIGMFEGKQRLEAISVNAASASLPGFRRHVVAGRAFDAALANTGAAASPPLVDLRPGALLATGRALDVAIDADDSFFALTDGAQTWLTRAGSFHVDPNGVLVGEGGLRVVGEQGDIRLPGGDVVVGADGSITHDGVVVAALQLFAPADPASLRAAQGSLLESPDGMLPVEGAGRRVRGATLEASNTDAGREMLSLMTVSRQFEALSRVLQGYDELLGRTIQKLGEI